MGILNVIELVNQVESGDKKLSEAVEQHLMTGFFKKISKEWIPICVDIIKRYKSGEHDLSYKIYIPNKDVFLTVERIIEDLHLELFMRIEII